MRKVLGSCGVGVVGKEGWSGRFGGLCVVIFNSFFEK